MSSSIVEARRKELTEKKARQEVLIKRRDSAKEGMKAIRDATSSETQSQLTTSSDSARQNRSKHQGRATSSAEKEIEVAEATVAAAEKDLKELNAEIKALEELLK